MNEKLEVEAFIIAFGRTDGHPTYHVLIGWLWGTNDGVLVQNEWFSKQCEEKIKITFEAIPK